MWILQGGEEKWRDGVLLGPLSFNAITGCPGHLIRVGTDGPRGRSEAQGDRRAIIPASGHQTSYSDRLVTLSYSLSRRWSTGAWVTYSVDLMWTAIRQTQWDDI